MHLLDGHFVRIPHEAVKRRRSPGHGKTHPTLFSYENGLNDVCFILPDILGTLCKQVQNEFGDYIVEAFKMGHSPDTLCHCLGQCRVDPGQEMCHFYPKPSGRPVCPIMNQSKLEKVKNDMRETLIDWCKDHQNIEVCQGLRAVHTQFISFFKSLSATVGSDIEQLWILNDNSDIYRLKIDGI